MDKLIGNLRIVVNEEVYLKDPESSDLGKRIVGASINMISELGFEQFTFKKLGQQIGSNESSIYRYFENKHKLLVYLTSWYWAWIEYQMVFHTYSIQDPYLKIQKAVEILSRQIKNDAAFSHINEEALQQLIIDESSKSYLTKEVDRENKEGYFLVYKRMVLRIKDMLLELQPNYPYALSLASTILEGTLHQQFLRDHFPTITDCSKGVSTQEFFMDLVEKCLKK